MLHFREVLSIVKFFWNNLLVGSYVRNKFESKIPFSGLQKEENIRLKVSREDSCVLLIRNLRSARQAFPQWTLAAQASSLN